MACIPFRHLALIAALSVAIGPALLAPACAPSPQRLPPPKPALAPPVAKPAWQARKVVPDAIVVPGGRRHTVKLGETGIAIARAYGVPWSRVVAANHLAPPYRLEVGDKLLLPDAAAVSAQLAAMSVEDRARAFRLNIDDLITGGEPAGPPPASTNRPTQPAVRAATVPASLPIPPGGAPHFQWPVDGRMLSGYGAKPGGRFNDGVNLKASAGSPVRAAADGVVAYAGDAIPGFGNLVLLKHAGDYVTAYAHNETLLVARGQRLTKGDVLARAGATGAVSEPQVHFEIRRGRTPVDPARLIGGR